MKRNIVLWSLAALIAVLTAGGAFAAAGASAGLDLPDAAQRALALVGVTAEVEGDEDELELLVEEDDTDTVKEESDTGTVTSFGEVRSAEARAFGECMEETQGDREACEDLKPGPAWQSDAHPVFGVGGSKEGQTPGESQGADGAASAALEADDGDDRGRPEGVGKPDEPGEDAVDTDEEDSGRPDDAGPPAEAGRSDGAGRPDDAGRPEGAGPAAGQP